jgi:DNA polymerase III sliding clamp (beta) subunit (PCNA family)
MPKYTVDRANLVKRLTAVKESDLNILGINIRKQAFLNIIKSLDNDILELSTGLITWRDELDEHGKVIPCGIKDKPCLQVYANHSLVKSTMRFVSQEVVAWGRDYKGTCVINLATGRDTTEVKPDITIDGEDFAKAVKNIAVYAATDETRPVLAGVFFKFGKHDLTLAGADGFRLGITKLKFTGELSGKHEYILPATDLIKRICPLAAMSEGKGKRKECNPIGLTLTDDAITFVKDSQSVTIGKIQGNFPQYDQLIPKDGIKITVNASQMLEAVKNISISARDGSGILRLKASGDKVTISAVSQEVSESETDIPAIVTEPCKIAANARYWLATLGQIADKEWNNKLDLYVTTPSSPMRIEWPNYTAVIMPMFIQWGEDKD